MTAPSDAERLLRTTALQVTKPRIAVLTAVHERPHADTDATVPPSTSVWAGRAAGPGQVHSCGW